MCAVSRQSPDDARVRVDLELSMTNAVMKGAVIGELRGRGFAAGTGAVRLGFPFTVEVKGVDERDVAGVQALAGAVDMEFEVISRVTIGEPDLSPAGS